MSNWVIFLCDKTGNMARPWVEAGYRALLVDPQHAPGVHYGHDGVCRVGAIIDAAETWDTLRKIIRNGRIAFVGGFPPCTDLAVSGARWFEDKWKTDRAFQFKAMHVVWQCQVIGELSGAPYIIENPVSVISSIWRKPDHTFTPWQYTAYAPQDNYNKKTLLWSGGDFRMPTPRIDKSLGPPDDRIHRAPPSDERANFRSATPMGFAIAVYKENGIL